jgi:hypothetical protein
MIDINAYNAYNGDIPRRKKDVGGKGARLWPS